MAHDPQSSDITVRFAGEIPKVSVMELQLVESHLADLVKAVLMQEDQEER